MRVMISGFAALTVVVMFGGAVLTSPAMADAGPVVVSECSGHCVTDVGGVATVVVKK